MTNILETYWKVKAEKRKKKVDDKDEKPRSCSNCVHGRFYDSEFEHQVINRRIYCSKWLIILRMDGPKSCPLYQANKEEELNNLKRWF